uniref:ribosomal protein L22 n=1 Tax=Porphyridium aerugineum TaxID=2792 RepID=UPI001FCD4C32|nr:ribosomal protein L22 [Porphyridium aerugineum]UNJ17886.1 ribosomal protein L22 [Porphyridium aerugineum]
MQKIKSQDTEAKAISKYIRMSPNKVRRVLDQIRGKEYKEAVMILQFMPYRSCKPILQTLQSAAANAEHNYGMDKSLLCVSQAYADQGPMLKRFQPRAQGRAYSIHKPSCHISIIVSAK